MVEIKVGGKEMRLRAAPPSLHFYDQEFKRDLIPDALSVVNGGKIEGLKVMRLVWVLEKTEHLGASFPSFTEWIQQFEYMDLTDKENLGKLVQELIRGFFRTAEPEGGDK